MGGEQLELEVRIEMIENSIPQRSDIFNDNGSFGGVLEISTYYIIFDLYPYFLFIATL